MNRISQFVGGVIATVLVVGGALLWNQQQIPSEMVKNDNELVVSFLDVGQGDATLIQTPGGKNFMIDTGPTGDLAQPLKKVLPKKSVIDGLFITHPHADHIGNIAYVLENYDVKKLYYTGVPHTTPTFTKNFEAVKNSGVEVVKIAKEQTFTTDDAVKFEVLYPNRDMMDEVNWEPNNDGLNDTSIVVQVTYGENSFLFMGDASKAIEKRLVGMEVVGKVDVLKVGHQGSYTSSGEDFIGWIKPTYGIIFVGEKNDYGHPHKVTLQTLARYGVKVFRTDEQGTITVTSDGNAVRVIPERGQSAGGN